MNCEQNHSLCKLLCTTCCAITSNVSVYCSYQNCPL